MRIAVASSDFTTVTGHAGRARKWLVYEVTESGDLAAPVRVELAADAVFHHAEDGRPHALDGVDAVIAQSAGDGFLRNMERRGIRAVLTAEPAPERAVRAVLADTVTPPRARPIGSLICKTIDLFSKHK